jgi:hypothetical protein
MPRPQGRAEKNHGQRETLFLRFLGGFSQSGYSMLSINNAEFRSPGNFQDPSRLRLGSVVHVAMSDSHQNRNRHYPLVFQDKFSNILDFLGALLALVPKTIEPSCDFDLLVQQVL